MEEDYEPKPGDIGIVRMTGWGGRAIRFGQWINGDGYRNYEHAYVVVGGYVRGSDRPGGTAKIIEAMPGGALLSPLAKYDNLQPVYLRCPDEYRSAVASAAAALQDTPYSGADYLALAAHRFHIPTPLLKRYIRNSGHLICSQLADHAAMVGGWHIFTDGRWEGDVTPGDLYRAYAEQRYGR